MKTYEIKLGPFELSVRWPFGNVGPFIVKFQDGRFAVKRPFRNLFVDALSPSYSWSSNSEFFEDCIVDTHEEAAELLNRINRGSKYERIP